MKKYYVLRDASSFKYVQKEEGRNNVLMSSFAMDCNRFTTVGKAEKFLEEIQELATGYFEIVPIYTNKPSENT